MAVDKDLPAPSSGLLLEVSFRRLLSSCEDIAGGDDKGRQDLRQWRKSPVFHHYVETLREQLDDLEGTGRVDPGLLQRYRQRASALSDQLERAEVPTYCRLAAAAAQHDGLGTATPPGGRLRVPAAAGPVRVPKLPPPSPAAAAGAGSLRPVPLSAAARGRLEAQGRLQETLTDELAEMASALKASTLSMEDKVGARGRLLDSAGEALERSAAGTKASAAKAAAVHRRGHVNFCFKLLVMLIIGAGFAAMYLFIRVTSFSGYTAHRAQQARLAMLPPPAVPAHAQAAAAAPPALDPGDRVNL